MRTALKTTLCLAMGFAAFQSAQAVTPELITITPANPPTLNAPLGGVSPGKIVKLKNAGATPASLGSMVIGGADAGDFALTADSCSNHVLAVKKTCSMTVQYTGDGAVNSVHQGLLEVQDPTATTLTSLQLNGKTKKASATITVAVSAQGVMTIRNTSAAGYQVSYNFLGQVDEGPGAEANICHQELDLAGGQSCSIHLLATSCQETKGAEIAVQAFADVGGAETDVIYILKKALTPPSFC